MGNAGDFEVVVPMLRQHRQRRQRLDAALFELHPDAEQRFRRWLGEMAQDPRSLLLVAEDEQRQPPGQVIGFLYATIENDPPIYLHDEFAIVREWWVEPPFRDGAAEALVERAAAELAAAGVRQLRIRTAWGEAEAQTMLQRCGFRSGACEMVRELG
jgi:hypothetical protein